MAKIELTKGFKAIVNKSDVPLLRRFKWRVQKACRTFYAITTSRNDQGRRTSLLMHRVILGAKMGEITDHIDGNGLNNRRRNIRITTSRMNSLNRHNKARGKYSKYIGVSWSKQKCKWIAYCDRKHIGYFRSEKMAHFAYRRALKELIT